jgi:hypothetical protein
MGLSEKYVNLCFDAAKIIFGGGVITPLVTRGEGLLATASLGLVGIALTIVAGIIIHRYNAKNKKK